MVNPHRADLESDTSNLGRERKASGVRPAAHEEEIQRLYRQLSDGSLDLSPPSIPPLMGHSSDDDEEPITETFELATPEAPKVVARDRGVLVRVDGQWRVEEEYFRPPCVAEDPRSAVKIC